MVYDIHEDCLMKNNVDISTHLKNDTHQTMIYNIHLIYTSASLYKERFKKTQKVEGWGFVYFHLHYISLLLYWKAS